MKEPAPYTQLQETKDMKFNLAEKWRRVKDLGIGKALAATVATHINSVSIGMCQGYSAILLPQLEESTSTVQVNTDEESWIASLGVITNPLGAILSGILMEWLGRKRAVQLVSIPFLIGWIMIAVSQDLLMLCIGRAITGMAIGMGAACYVYVAEISLPEHRGFLSAFGPIFVSLGVLLVYCFGYFFHWQLAAVACGATAIISFSVITFIPESPTWFMAQGQEDKAKESIVWLRGENERSLGELSEMTEARRTKDKVGEATSCMQTFTQPSVWKPFLILIVFFIFQEGSGLYIILYYAVNFFQESGSTMDKYVLSIIVATTRLAMSIVGTICIKSFNRRTMAMASGVVMALSMGVSGTYEFFYGCLSVNDRPLSWIPQVCIVANVCGSMLGMLQLPWVMIGELFPSSVRGIMGGIVSSLGYFFIFLVVKAYPNFLTYLQMYGMMWLFAVISLLVIGFAALFLPETQGKSLLEIEHLFYGIKTKHKDAESGDQAS